MTYTALLIYELYNKHNFILKYGSFITIIKFCKEKLIFKFLFFPAECAIF